MSRMRTRSSARDDHSSSVSGSSTSPGVLRESETSYRACRSNARADDGIGSRPRRELGHLERSTRSARPGARDQGQAAATVGSSKGRQCNPRAVSNAWRAQDHARRAGVGDSAPRVVERVCSASSRLRSLGLTVAASSSGLSSCRRLQRAVRRKRERRALCALRERSTAAASGA